MVYYDIYWVFNIYIIIKPIIIELILIIMCDKCNAYIIHIIIYADFQIFLSIIFKNNIKIFKSINNKNENETNNIYSKTL